MSPLSVPGAARVLVKAVVIRDTSRAVTSTLRRVVNLGLQISSYLVKAVVG